MKRLTKQRVERWEKEAETLQRKLGALYREMEAYQLSAKGGRYDRIGQMRAPIVEAFLATGESAAKAGLLKSEFNTTKETA